MQAYVACVKGGRYLRPTPDFRFHPQVVWYLVLSCTKIVLYRMQRTRSISTMVDVFVVIFFSFNGVNNKKEEQNNSVRERQQTPPPMCLGACDSTDLTGRVCK